MTKMAAMPIYGKNLKNRILWNRYNDFNETWYEALGSRVHHNLYKSWPCVDLDLFDDKVKFDQIGF